MDDLEAELFDEEEFVESNLPPPPIFDWFAFQEDLENQFLKSKYTTKIKKLESKGKNVGEIRREMIRREEELHRLFESQMREEKEFANQIANDLISFHRDLIENSEKFRLDPQLYFTPIAPVIDMVFHQPRRSPSSDFLGHGELNKSILLTFSQLEERSEEEREREEEEMRKKTTHGGGDDLCFPILLPSSFGRGEEQLVWDISMFLKSLFKCLTRHPIQKMVPNHFIISHILIS